MEDYRANNDPALNAALNSVPRRSLPELLKEALASGDLERVAARDREWRADPVNAWVDTEVSLNSLGYELVAAGRLDQAIAVFRVNAAAYPRSANAWDSLGEACMKKGDKESAIRSYEKALEINPNQRSAIDALKILRAR
jgi:tetratricopeptide (TPR) repeat protein